MSNERKMLDRMNVGIHPLKVLCDMGPMLEMLCVVTPLIVRDCIINGFVSMVL